MVKKRKLVLYFYIIIVLSSYFLAPEITFSCGILGLIMAGNNRTLSLKDFKELLLPLLLLPVGLLFALQNGTRDILRDVFFFLNPIVIFLFGCICSKYIPIYKLLRTFVYLGLVFALVYLVSHNYSSNYESVSQFREEEGNTSYVVVVSLAILIISRVKKITLFNKKQTYIFMAILLGAVIIASSRTFLLVFIICLVVGLGYLKLNDKLVLRGLVLLMLGGLGIFLLVSIGNTDRHTFLGKLTTSLDEISIEQKTSKRDINANWRGYEGYRGVLQFKKGDALEWVFGQGFGALAPLGITIKLGEKEFDAIPKFHNGYIHILLKTGILGMILYLGFLIKILIKYIQKRSRTVILDLQINLTTAFALVLLLTTTVIAGWINQKSLTPIILMLGYFITNIRTLANPKNHSND